MSNHWRPRFPPNQGGRFAGPNPRFPPLQPPPNEGYRPRQDHFEGPGRPYFQPRQGFYSRGRHPAPYRGFRPDFGFRGRGRGPRGRYGRGGFNQGPDRGIEAYYKHSMVEDPWKKLEEKQAQKAANFPASST